MTAQLNARGDVAVLVPAAGAGLRLGPGGPKALRLLAGEPLLVHVIRRVAAAPSVRMIVVAAPAPEVGAVRDLLAPVAPVTVVAGGAERQESVSLALAAVPDEIGIVLVHDAARALLRPEWVDRLIEACQHDEVGGLLALPVADTLKSEQAGRAAATVDRRGKWVAQTPQMFRIGPLRDALMRAGASVTDDAGAIEAMGLQPKLVMGDAANLKITWPEDFARAQALLAARAGASAGASAGTLSLRLGEGWDVHALVPGAPLVLGGVQVPHTHGLLAHSDGDALLHAIIDALLGAAALGDIGRHFPDTDAAFKGADSMVLLGEAAQRVRTAGYRIVNVDSTIVAQAPKLAPHIDAMRERIAAALALPRDCVNVKAKTAEKMGPVGEGRAIEARAVCLLQRV